MSRRAWAEVKTRPQTDTDERAAPFVPAPAEMYAAVLAEPHSFRINPVPTPSPDRGMVRVLVEGCGVCASNIPPWEGRPWFNYPLPPGEPGHEGWGFVEALGDDVTGLRVGQRVTMLSCHAYAQYDIAAAASVIPLPDSFDGRPFPGEPLGCAVNIFHRSGITKGTTVAVVGAGFLGCLLIQLASKAGARVFAISRREGSLEFAKSFGAERTILMDDHWRIIDAVSEATDGKLCDVAVEAVGKQWPLDLAGELVRESGRLVIAGYHQDGARQVNVGMWNWRGLDVVNAHERDSIVCLDGVREAVEAVASGTLNPWPLFTHTYPLEKLGEALALTRDRPAGFMKALITIGA